MDTWFTVREENRTQRLLREIADSFKKIVACVTAVQLLKLAL